MVDNSLWLSLNGGGENTSFTHKQQLIVIIVYITNGCSQYVYIGYKQITSKKNIASSLKHNNYVYNQITLREQL